MNRRQFLASGAAVVTAFGLAGCSNGNGGMHVQVEKRYVNGGNRLIVELTSWFNCSGYFSVPRDTGYVEVTVSTPNKTQTEQWYPSYSGCMDETETQLSFDIDGAESVFVTTQIHDK